MAKDLVPSEIVNFIDKYFPEAKASQDKTDHSSVKIDPGRFGGLSALVQMVEGLNAALLPTSAGEIAELRLAIEHIKYHIELIMAGKAPAPLPHVPQSGRQDAVVMIRRILERCPDTPVPDKEEDCLLFVKDRGYRQRLLVDLQEVQADLNHGQWKSATVLGGSLIEALLLEALSTRSQQELGQSTHYQQIQDRKPQLEDWNLFDYLKASHETGLIEQDGYDLGIKGKDFRNLIHPGRAQREQIDFSRATALTVRAALEQVIEDLEKNV